MIFGNWRPGGLLARRRPVRLHRRAPAARRRRRPCTRCCSLVAVAAAGRRRSGSSAAARRVARRRSLVVAACCRWSGTSLTDAVPARVHQHDAVRHDAAGAGASPRNGCGCRRPTGRSTARARRADAARPDASTGTRCTARRVEAMRRTPTRRTPTSRSAPPALVDDGRVVVGCNVENAAYGVGAVRRVRAWSRSCTPPAAAG